MLTALVSCFLLCQTVYNLIDFVQSTRKIEVDIAELCPIDDDSYQLDVVVRNRSKHTITVEGYIFRVHYEERLIASIIQLEEVSVGASDQHTEHLLLTTNLAPERRPEQPDSCGFAPGWTASGHIFVVLPCARGEFKLEASAGGG
jgi:hypothetical protein